MPNKTMLYIRHAYHSKTKSNDFLVDILKKHYEIIVYDIDPCTQDDETMLKQAPTKNVDVLLLFQLPINGDLIRKYIKFEKGVFFPMYDGVPSRQNKIWLSWKDFNIINFSKTLHNELLNMGFSSFYIQYFPKPLNFASFGNQDSAFFWQRLTDLNINMFNDIFKNLAIKNIHIHKAIDPKQKFITPTNMKYRIEYSNWYDQKKEMLKDIEKSSFYIAPRFYEGIGMSFLEAMAMGRCVISCNHPTMNEYIKDGITGILYDDKDPKLYKTYNIQEIQDNALKYINNGYKNWEKDKMKISDYINSPVNIDKTKLESINFKDKENINFLQNIFSITNSEAKIYKIITILGFQIKIKNRK